MTEVWRVVGPPGTGKTSWIAERCRRRVARYGDESCTVISLTRAAAAEAAGKDTGLSSQMVGTLHSLCFRAIGQPKVVEEPRSLKQWNEEMPQFEVTPQDAWEWGDPGGSLKTLGDRLLASVNMRRHLLQPREAWPPMERTFHDAWTDYKKQLGGIDFCDMIERALYEIPVAPHAPSYIFCDERQDMSPLEMAVLKRWSQSAEQLILVYDPAQALYGWRGADPETAMDEPSKILDTSWRVPRAVQELALDVVRRSSTYREAVYHARADVGLATRSTWTLQRPEEFAGDLDDPFSGPTMVLASCSYMLDGLVRELRRLGVPYHNPYSPTRWNPLRAGTFDRKTAVDRLLAYTSFADSEVLMRDQLEMVASSVKKEALNRGWREVIERLDPNPTIGELVHANRLVFSGTMIEKMYARDLDFYMGVLKKPHADSAEYPVAVLKRADERCLREVSVARRPVRGAVVVGTIHSVKGGEAERVVLFPDLSRAARSSLARPGWLDHDSVFRMLYVGCTRARQELVLGRAAHPFDDTMIPAEREIEV